MRKLLAIIMLVLLCLLFPMTAMAEDIPFGVTEKKLEAVLEKDWGDGLIDLLPTGYPGSIKGDGINEVGARYMIPFRQVYRLAFYNVGAMKGEAFSEAILTIETFAKGPGKMTIENPDPETRAKQPLKVVEDSDLPEFKTFTYKLRFTGGYNGIFTSLSKEPEILNFYGPRTIKMKVANDGSQVVFDIPNVSIEPLAVKPEGAFDDWVKAATGKDPVKAVSPSIPEADISEPVEEESDAMSPTTIAAIAAGLLIIIGAGMGVKKLSGKGSDNSPIEEQAKQEDEDDESEDEVSLELTYPAGRSPNVFTEGWIFGARCIVKNRSGEIDISDTVQWSGSGNFEPSVGSLSRPSFASLGANTIVLTASYGGQTVTKQYSINTISPEGYAAVGDLAFSNSVSLGCPACPHPAAGQFLHGSSSVTVNGKPAIRVGDGGSHSLYNVCGTNLFEVIEGDESVLIDGKPAARLGDTTDHIGGRGVIARELPEGLKNKKE